MTWTLNTSFGTKGPRCVLYENGLAVNRGDLVIPAQWSLGTNAGTPADGTCLSAYHVTTAGTLGSEPVSNWPGAAEDQFLSCGTARFRSKNLYYVDPNAGANGTGSQLSPIKVPSSASATNGRVVILRKGSQFLGSADFSASGSITNGTYGWILSSSTDANETALPIIGTLPITNCQAVVVDGLMAVGTGLANGFPYTQGAGTAASEIYYRDCVANGVRSTGGNNDGFVVNSAAATNLSVADNGIWYENCAAISCGGYGFGLEACNTAQGAITPVTYYNCYASGNGIDKNAWNFGGYARFTTASTGWTRVGGAGTFIYSRTEATTTCRVADHGGSNFSQLVSAGATSSPASGQWGQTGGVLYINLGVDTGTSLTGHQLYWSYNYCDGVLFYNCRSTAAITKTTDGSGFGCDTLTANWLFLDCLAYANQGEGFVSNIALSPTFIGCISSGNNLSYSSSIVINNTDTATIQNCTSIGSNAGSGVGGTNPNGTIVVTNSILANNATYGLVKSGTLTENNNCIFGNLVGTVSGQAIDASDLTVNPQLDSKYRPLNASVQRQIRGAKGTDYYNKEFAFLSDIGAVQTWAIRSFVARSLAVSRSFSATRLTTLRASTWA